MAKITPNDLCPCGLETKYKKCCGPYFEGKSIETAERLLRLRYVALINQNNRFLWESLHPQSMRRQFDNWNKFENEHKLLKAVNYQKLILLDGDVSKKDKAVFVQYVIAQEGEIDLSYLEESQFSVFEGQWYYFDGLRRSSSRIGCQPESVKIGELATFFLHGSKHN